MTQWNYLLTRVQTYVATLFCMHGFTMKWMNLALFVMQERLEQELKSVQKYRKYWNHIKKKDAQADEQTKTKWVPNVAGTHTYTYIVALILSCIYH